MRKVMLIVGLVAGAGYYLFGGQTLNEELVHEFYRDQMHATLSRNPDDLCKQLHADYQGVGSVAMAGQHAAETVDHDQACEATHQMYEQIVAIGDQLGGMATLGYTHEIRSIEVSDDSREAIVETTFSMEIAGAFMEIQGVSTDTLVRRHGKMYLLKSDSRTRVTSG